MDNLDFINLQKDELFEVLRAKMEDGGFDEWVNVPTATVRKYLDFMILEELEALVDKVGRDIEPLNKRVLYYAATLKAIEPPVEEESI